MLAHAIPQTVLRLQLLGATIPFSQYVVRVGAEEHVGCGVIALSHAISDDSLAVTIDVAIVFLYAVVVNILSECTVLEHGNLLSIGRRTCGRVVQHALYVSSGATLTTEAHVALAAVGRLRGLMLRYLQSLLAHSSMPIFTRRQHLLIVFLDGLQ